MALNSVKIVHHLDSEFIHPSQTCHNIAREKHCLAQKRMLIKLTLYYLKSLYTVTIYM
jgi:hypothetical protein